MKMNEKIAVRGLLFLSGLTTAALCAATYLDAVPATFSYPAILGLAYVFASAAMTGRLPSYLGWLLR